MNPPGIVLTRNGLLEFPAVQVVSSTRGRGVPLFIGLHKEEKFSASGVNGCFPVQPVGVCKLQPLRASVQLGAADKLHQPLNLSVSFCMKCTFGCNYPVH